MVIIMKFVKRCIVVIFLFNIICLNVNFFADIENEDEINSLESIETNSDNTYKVPKVLSKYAICIERTTGTILFENDAYEKTAMASTTKIMTAIIAIEKGNLNDIVTISKKAAQINGSRLELKENIEDGIDFNIDDKKAIDDTIVNENEIKDGYIEADEETEDGADSDELFSAIDDDESFDDDVYNEDDMSDDLMIDDSFDDEE